MPIPKFLCSFGTQDQYAEALRRARRPQRFHCPRCGIADHYVVGHGAHQLFECDGCRHQTSLTSDSLMEHTTLALTLKRQLGMSYPTAWQLHHKINRAMAKQDSTHRRRCPTR